MGCLKISETKKKNSRSNFRYQCKVGSIVFFFGFRDFGVLDFFGEGRRRVALRIFLNGIETFLILKKFRGPPELGWAKKKTVDRATPTFFFTFTRATKTAQKMPPRHSYAEMLAEKLLQARMARGGDEVAYPSALSWKYWEINRMPGTETRAMVHRCGFNFSSRSFERRLEGQVDFWRDAFKMLATYEQNNPPPLWFVCISIISRFV